jgi:hypothetical protein
MNFSQAEMDNFRYGTDGGGSTHDSDDMEECEGCGEAIDECSCESDVCEDCDLPLDECECEVE